MRAVKLFIKLIISLLLVLTFIVGLFYIQTTIYNFASPAPFSGDSLINPYQNINNQSLKCNFHAHTEAWGGFTNGHDTPEDLTAAYTKNGYQVAGVSNYHCIEKKSNSQSPIYVPVYEHGVNLFKSHKLAINAAKPSFFDFPLWQNTSQKQQIINRIRDNDGLVAIAHPKFLDGHTLKDMSQLTNYQFVEVLNHYRISDEYWDAALTAGRLVYGIGNDDTHDINNEPTFKMWTEVYADTATPEGVLNALKQGKSYAVNAFEGKCDLKLDSVKLTKYDYGKLINLIVSGQVKTVEAWYPNHVVDTVYGAHNKNIRHVTGPKLDTLVDRPFQLIMAFPKDKAYVRYVIKSDNCALYLNPIVRSKDGKTAGIDNLAPELNWLKTILYRLVVLIIELLLIVLFLYIWRIKPFKR